MGIVTWYCFQLCNLVNGLLYVECTCFALLVLNSLPVSGKLLCGRNPSVTGTGHFQDIDFKFYCKICF